MTNAAQRVNPSRRHLLRGAGVAGLAATAIAVEQIARPAPALAANGASLIIGEDNQGTSATTLENTAATDYGLEVTSNAAGFAAIAGFNDTSSTSGVSACVYGQSNDNAVGVYGYSQNNWGVAAHSATSTAMQAQSIDGVGVVGVSDSVTAIYGQSGASNGFKLTKDAIRGFTDSAAGSGIRGENVGGGTGVTGVATSKGKGGGGTGVLAQAAGAGTALKVEGRAAFSRAGDVEIKSPKTSATVSVPGGLSPTSLVLALLQSANPGVFVTSAVPNSSTGEVTIHLNKAPGVGKSGGAAKVAWFVVN